ncbi:hypothetical protein Hanom_Chr14g01287871 [Helianthus anomalus]
MGFLRSPLLLERGTRSGQSPITHQNKGRARVKLSLGYRQSVGFEASRSTFSVLELVLRLIGSYGFSSF